jgi:hypothetical protein
MQTSRNAISAPSRAGPRRDTAQAPKPAPIGPISASIGMSGPLARIAPDPKKAITADYQDSQTAIGNYVTGAVQAMWDAHIDPENFASSWRDLGPIMKILVAQHYTGSAAQAAEYYRNLRVTNGLGRPRLFSAPLDVGHLSRVVGSVAGGEFYHQVSTRKSDTQHASTSARNKLARAANRFAMLGGRNTVTQAVAQDPEATGWDRLLSPGACSSCASLAARGPFKPGVTAFRAHDSCHCLASPVFRGSGPANPELIQAWNQVAGGISGKDARAAWEEYWRQNNGGD